MCLVQGLILKPITSANALGWICVLTPKGKGVERGEGSDLCCLAEGPTRVRAPSLAGRQAALLFFFLQVEVLLK